MFHAKWPEAAVCINLKEKDIRFQLEILEVNIERQLQQKKNGEFSMHTSVALIELHSSVQHAEHFYASQPNNEYAKA